jgi:hypothetical protein
MFRPPLCWLCSKAVVLRSTAANRINPQQVIRERIRGSPRSGYVFIRYESRLCPGDSKKSSTRMTKTMLGGEKRRGSSRL